MRFSRESLCAAREGSSADAVGLQTCHVVLLEDPLRARLVAASQRLWCRIGIGSFAQLMPVCRGAASPEGPALLPGTETAILRDDPL